MKTLRYPKVSSAVSASWEDPKTHAARCMRWACHVYSEGKPIGFFSSVPAAFKSLRLQLNKHIKFRGRMVREGKATFTQGGVTYEFHAERLK